MSAEIIRGDPLDHRSRQLLEAPDSVSLTGKRDWSILATLLCHTLRRDELCRLKVKDVKNERRGVALLKMTGKGGKTRYVPLHPAASGLVLDYLETGHSNSALLERKDDITILKLTR